MPLFHHPPQPAPFPPLRPGSVEATPVRYRPSTARSLHPSTSYNEDDEDEGRLVIDTGVEEEPRPSTSKRPPIPKMRFSLNGPNYQLTVLPPSQTTESSVEDYDYDPMKDDDLDNLDYLDNQDELNINPFRENIPARKKDQRSEEEKLAKKVECRYCHKLYGKYYINKHMV